jgi:hypothetical protein
MDSFPSSKAHELETEFDGLVPMMSCNDVDDETSYRKKNRHDGTNSSDEESNYSGSEGEEEQISQQPTLSAMKDVSEVFGQDVFYLKRSAIRSVKLNFITPTEITPKRLSYCQL